LAALTSGHIGFPCAPKAAIAFKKRQVKLVGFIKQYLRRASKSPAVYSLARRMMLLGQYILRRPDEPDLRAFQSFRKHSGLVVDIGANGGQSAFAFAHLLPGYEIISFEPNPALWPELDFAARWLGPKFSYRKLGLGPAPAAMTLFVPCVGDLPITTRASLSETDAVAHCATLEAETGKSASIIEIEVQIAPFDSLELRPDFIKIDVEGFELGVLEGMRRTLTETRPIVMAESNSNNEACWELLKGCGYCIFWYDRQARALVEQRQAKANNWFAVPIRA
jgi:FkbM family methyltransferase